MAHSLRQFSSSSLDTESLWQELIDASFDVDEFLENHIKQSLAFSKLQPVDSDLSLFYPLPKLNTGLDSTDHSNFFANFDSTSSFADITSNNSYDTARVLRSLNDLFDACVFINSKAAYQHQHAEEELRNVEEDASQQLLIRVDKVKLNLLGVGKLQDELKDLSEKIKSVGDKISSITKPQEHLLEAHRLLTYFIELDREIIAQLTYPELLQQRETLEDYQKAAGIILALHRISSTLAIHQDGTYALAREKIVTLYNEIESDLIVLFARAYEQQPIDLNVMQQIAIVLQNFPMGFSLAISTFVERAVTSVANISADPFRHIIQVCNSTYKLIHEVFPGPNLIMEKFITQVVCHQIEPLIQITVAKVPKTIANLEPYLHSLYDLYRRTKALEPALSKFKGLRMPEIIHMLFGYHLEVYMQSECKFLRTRCTALLQQYYDVLALDLGITSNVGTVEVLPEQKDFFMVNLDKSIPMVISDYLIGHPNVSYDGKLISESLCLGILNELRQSASRALTLIPSDDIGPCLLELGNIVITFIAVVHLDYGMEIGIRALPAVDMKTEPKLHFFKLVRNSTVLFELLTQQINECLRRIGQFKVEAGKLNEELEYGKDRIERKATIGIESSLNSAMNYLHNLLAQQKKSEFANLDNRFSVTPTAFKVAELFARLIQLINENLTGKNHWNVSAELGARFHREVIDHFDDFKFNNEEAMIFICDVKEYREAALLLNIESVTKMFNDMLLLANLLVADGTHLLQICQEIYRDLGNMQSISYMLRLREDFRSITDTVAEYI